MFRGSYCLALRLLRLLRQAASRKFRRHPLTDRLTSKRTAMIMPSMSTVIDGESDVTLAMAELSADDRKYAEAQKFCAVMNTSLLGSMGAPLKLDVQGQPVFVCCAGCKSKALKNPDETLATVAKLKAENSTSKE